jgi:hypothetical protein
MTDLALVAGTAPPGAGVAREKSSSFFFGNRTRFAFLGVLSLVPSSVTARAFGMGFSGLGVFSVSVGRTNG